MKITAAPATSEQRGEPARRQFGAVGLAAVVLAVVLLAGAACGGPPARAGGSGGSTARPVRVVPQTIVSLTFDDGTASQYNAAMSMLAPRGMAGTFYVNSAMVGTSGYYMTWWDLQDLYHAGQEIGGHTAHHTNLATVSTAKARAEVCQDRATLLKRNLGPVESFAYPYAGFSPADEAIVKSCGYRSARDVGNLRDPQCPMCAWAEIIPPADPYRLRTASDAAGWPLKRLKKTVTRVENHGGGWVTLVFHGICDHCTRNESLSPTTFRSFLDWLEQRRSRGTVVRTVGEVMRSARPTHG